MSKSSLTQNVVCAVLIKNVITPQSVLLFILVAFLAGCKKEFSPNETMDLQTTGKVDPNRTATVQKSSTDPLSGTVNQYLAEPLRVQVLSKTGRGLAGAVVTFEVTSGGGIVDQESVVTDRNGYAQTAWKPGDLIGTQTVQASAADRQGSTISGSPLTFSANVALAIGASYAGGIVFHIDESGRHGMVCAPSDAGAFPWDMTPFSAQNWEQYNPPFVGAGATTVGSGSTNTTLIANTLGQNSYAAYVCSTFENGGYSDWYLPSKDELNQMYVNLKVPNLATFSSASLSYYYSSSEIDYRAVWCQRFNDGYQHPNSWKNNVMNVRPVRSF